MPSSRILWWVALVGSYAAFVPEVPAQLSGDNLGAYLTLGSDYRNRGLSQTGEDASVQIGIDYQHDSGFFAGGWVANVEFAAEQRIRSDPRDLEFDYYAGYQRQLDDWSLTGTLVHYSFPGASVSYDYSEVFGNIGYRERIFLNISYTDSLLSHNQSALNYELSVALPLPWSMELGAALGSFESDDVVGGDFAHWHLGVSKLVGRLVLDLRYHDTDYDFVTHLGDPASERWVFSLSYRI